MAEIKKRRVDTRKRNRAVKVLPAVCCECGRLPNWRPTLKNITVDYRGTSHDIEVEMLKCENCQNTVFGHGHLDILQSKLSRKASRQVLKTTQ